MNKIIQYPGLKLYSKALIYSMCRHMIWFVYIAFNYLSVSLVELNKILYCGYLSLGAHSLVLWPYSFRHYNFHVNKSCFEASVFGHWGSQSSLAFYKGSNKQRTECFKQTVSIFLCVASDACFLFSTSLSVYTHSHVRVSVLSVLSSTPAVVSCQF